MTMRSNLHLPSALIVLLLMSSSVFGYRPEIVSSTPRGMQRGTTQKVVIQGVRLTDSRQLILDKQGINVLSLKPLDDKKVEVELEVPETTKPGLYPLRIAAETGLSNVLMFSIGALPTID